jgi:putative hemolysin
MDGGIFIAVVIGISLVLSFLFSGMEAGVLALSRLRVRQLMRAGNKRAQVLHGYLEKPEDFLWTILVGNTLANFVAVGLLVVLLHRWLAGLLVVQILAFVVIMFLFYTFFELLPKVLFRTVPNRLTLTLTPPYRFIHQGLRPFVWLLSSLSRGLLHWTGGRAFTGHLFGTREEMRLVMQESAQGLTSEERLMINRVLDLQNITVRQIALPMDSVASITTRTPMSDVLKLAREQKTTRLPVWRIEANRKRIAGIVSLRTLLYSPDLDLTKTAGDYLKPALYMEEDLRLEAALKRMQRSGQRMAIVLARDQREIGIISLQDILKVIFGEVRL